MHSPKQGEKGGRKGKQRTDDINKNTNSNMVDENPITEIIALNANSLTSPIKWQRLWDGVKKPNYMWSKSMKYT